MDGEQQITTQVLDKTLSLSVMDQPDQCYQWPLSCFLAAFQRWHGERLGFNSSQSGHGDGVQCAFRSLFMFKEGEHFFFFALRNQFFGNLLELVLRISLHAKAVIQEIGCGDMGCGDLFALRPAERGILLLQDFINRIVKPREMAKFESKLISLWQQLRKVAKQH